jgi:RNA polymerase sigma factor (sigma-70 family)
MRTQAQKPKQKQPASMIETSDAALVSRSLNKDDRAFESLVQRYGPTIFKFIYRYFGEYDQSCDIMQQVFLQLYISLPRLDTKRPLKNWLYQVARNRCLDELRKKRPILLSDLENEENEEEKWMIDDIRDPRPSPEEIAEQHELQAYVLNAIEQLPPNFRSVVYLRYTSQLSFAEIGRKLGIPETTAKTHFHRARQYLRTYLN